MNYDPEYPMLARISLNSTHGYQVNMRRLSEALEEHGATIIETLKCDTEGHDVRILSSVPEIFEKNAFTRYFSKQRPGRVSATRDCKNFANFSPRTVIG
jgi:hypothetical protein